MNMINHETHQQISDLVNACTGYWELRGISEPQRREMRLELEQHVEQAIHDGKSLEAVVGPNALTFAESWARETPHQLPRGGAAVLRQIAFNWLVYALLFLLLIALFEHLILRSPTFPFTLIHLFAFAFIGVYTLLQAFSGFFSPRIASREYRLRVAFGIYVVINVLALLLLSLMQVPWQLALFRWNWLVTLFLPGGVCILFGLKMWFARNERQKRLL